MIRTALCFMVLVWEELLEARNRHARRRVRIEREMALGARLGRS